MVAGRCQCLEEGASTEQDLQKATSLLQRRLDSISQGAAGQTGGAGETAPRCAGEESS